MKGGHASGETCEDYLLTREDGEHWLQAERIDTQNTHGTGCTLSASIAAGLARGMGLVEAVRAAHAYLHSAILRSDELGVGNGHGPVHHFHNAW